MPTARELLEQADLLMRRNRAGQVDTEIPELTQAVSMPVIAPEPPSASVALADIPELTDAVEEIEIASIVEMPDDDLESNGWPPSDDEELAADVVTLPEAAPAAPPASRVPEPIGGRILPLFAIAGKPHESAVPAPAGASEAEPAVAAAWAEEIRMQVLQRIDLFTGTRLGEQLSAQMQPIVERASAEMVATINAQIGTLLRACIAEAIEREIEKWRDGNT